MPIISLCFTDETFLWVVSTVKPVGGIEQNSNSYNKTNQMH